MRSVLFVVTAANAWTLTDGTEHPTGYWAEELAEPHRLFSEAGWQITIATPGGVAPTLDEFSMGFAGGSAAKRDRMAAYLVSIGDQLAHPLPLVQVDESAFDLVFYPGGHGPMADLAFDEVSGALLTRRLHSGRPLALLCHAPVAILAAKNEDGTNPFAGYRMTGLSNVEERLNAFAWKAPWFLEDALVGAGVDYHKHPIPLRPYIEVDANVYTGQNPASAEMLAERLIHDLSITETPGTSPNPGLQASSAAPSLFDPLPLAHGAPIPNRIGKAAMEEQLGTYDHLPSKRLLRLYETWAKGGAGLIITGNVHVDARALTGAAGMVLDADTPLGPFKLWAQAAKQGGAQVWMQINHPGRQMPAALPGTKVAPSAVAVDLGKQSKRFAMPEPLTQSEIEALIDRFVTTATRAVEAGFDGVQIHAAHGYLISQFLSPLTNLRDDQWGGDLEHCSRFLCEIVRRTRSALTDHAQLAVKLNSADFQRGGFDVDDAKEVVAMLGELGVDLVEVSGGNYESPAMQGPGRDEHSLEREAYFLTFAAEMAKVAPMPLMVTGGITRRETAEQVLASGVDVVGIGTAMSVMPGLPNRWRIGEMPAPKMSEPTFEDKGVNALARMAQVRYQLKRLGFNQPPKPTTHPARILVEDQLINAIHLHHYKKWLAHRGG